MPTHAQDLPGDDRRRAKPGDQRYSPDHTAFDGGSGTRISLPSVQLDVSRKDAA